MTNQPPKKEKKFVDSLICSYGLGILSAVNSEIVTYPLDLVKTRLQIQGEVANVDAKVTGGPKRGTLSTSLGIIKEEGFFKLWNGMSAMVLRHVFYAGSRIVIYTYLREEVFHIKPGDSFPLWKSTICGAISGGFAQFISSPADIAKIHMQVEGKRRLMGETPRVTGVKHALLQRYKEAGVTGLWKGAVPNVQRAIAVTIGDMTGYDLSKRFILRELGLPDGTVVHIMASIVAGFCGAVLATPSDTVKTRIMNQPFGPNGEPLIYLSTGDCFMKTIKNEGFIGLYKGFIPLWIRLAPWALVFWVSFEKMKYLLGAAQF